MRSTIALIVMFTACSDKKAAEPPAAAPSAPAQAAASAPAPAPAPTPAPPPARPDPADAAIAAGTKIFTELAPVMADDRDSCSSGLKDLDKTLATLADETKTLDAALADADIAKRFTTVLHDDSTPLGKAWSASVGPAMHCGKVSDRLYAIVHIKVK